MRGGTAPAGRFDQTTSVSSSAVQTGQRAAVFTGILEATGRTTKRVREVAGHTALLTDDARQLADQMHHLAALAEENSAMAEEMLASNVHVMDSVNQVQAVGQRAVALVGQVETAVKGLTDVVAEMGATSEQLGALAGALRTAN